MQRMEETMKGNNYAARHDAWAFSAPVCLVRRTGKTKYEKGESRTGARLRRMQALFSSGFAR